MVINLFQLLGSVADPNFLIRIRMEQFANSNPKPIWTK